MHGAFTPVFLRHYLRRLIADGTQPNSTADAKRRHRIQWFSFDTCVETNSRLKRCRKSRSSISHDCLPIGRRSKWKCHLVCDSLGWSWRGAPHSYLHGAGSAADPCRVFHSTIQLQAFWKRVSCDQSSVSTCQICRTLHEAGKTHNIYW